MHEAVALLTAMTLSTFDLQGHRGARGHLPENTLPSVERLLVREPRGVVRARADAADVIALQFLIGQRMEDRRGRAHPLPIRAAREVRIERAVVVHHHHAVARHADVELEGVDAELDRALERGQGVLGQVAACTAVPLQVDGHRRERE